MNMEGTPIMTKSIASEQFSKLKLIQHNFIVISSSTHPPLLSPSYFLSPRSPRSARSLRSPLPSLPSPPPLSLRSPLQLIVSKHNLLHIITSNLPKSASPATFSTSKSTPISPTTAPAVAPEMLQRLQLGITKQAPYTSLS